MLQVLSVREPASACINSTTTTCTYELLLHNICNVGSSNNVSNLLKQQLKCVLISQCESKQTNKTTTGKWWQINSHVLSLNKTIPIQYCMCFYNLYKTLQKLLMVKNRAWPLKHMIWQFNERMPGIISCKHWMTIQWLIISYLMEFDQRESSRLCHCYFIGMKMWHKQLGFAGFYHNVPTFIHYRRYKANYLPKDWYTKFSICVHNTKCPCLYSTLSMHTLTLTATSSVSDKLRWAMTSSEYCNEKTLTV